MKYYTVTMVCEVPDEVYNEWDSQCDEIFHGPAGHLHSPKNNNYVVSYDEISEDAFNRCKYSLFTEEGGI